MAIKKKYSPAEIKRRADRAEGKAKKQEPEFKPLPEGAEDPAAKRKPRGGRDAKGHFLPGNRFWEARSSAGPKPKFREPETLWAACLEYFDWCHNNPLYEDRLVTFQGEATHEPVAKMRAMTVGGLCLFLDVAHQTWIEWRHSRPDLREVITQAEDVIRQQKFAGAAADLLNANIIARDLGLADKSELTGKDGGPVETKNVSDMDRAKAIATIFAAAMKAKS